MRTIKSVGVLSVAKISGLVYAGLALILMPIFLIVGFAGTLAGGRNSGVSGLVSIVIAVLLPVIYGLLGFVFGAIGGFFYNICAKWVGGIEVEVDAPAVAPPMPPLTSQQFS